MKKIENNIYPSIALIPLSQGDCEMSQSIVSNGQEILAGQILAKAQNENQVNIFSSVSGRVVGVEEMKNTCNGFVKTFFIHCDKEQKVSKPISMPCDNNKDFVELIKYFGLLDCSKKPLWKRFEKFRVNNQIDNLNIFVFDEFCGYDLQEYLFQNEKNLYEYFSILLSYFKIDSINLFFSKINGKFERIIEKLQKKLKKSTKICFFELKLSKIHNNYEKFDKYLLKKRNSNISKNSLNLTLSNIIQIGEVVKTKLPIMKQTIYVGGSALKQTNKFLTIPLGSSLEFVKNLCGDVVFDENSIDQMNDEMLDALEKYQSIKTKINTAKSKDEKLSLKKECKKAKVNSDILVKKFVKEQRKNLGFAIRQIRMQSKKYGKIATDFSTIIDASEYAVYFLNRNEC